MLLSIYYYNYDLFEMNKKNLQYSPMLITDQKYSTFKMLKYYFAKCIK